MSDKIGNTDEVKAAMGIHAWACEPQTLPILGSFTCEMCGEDRPCVDVGSEGFPEARCALCYADGVGHGAQFSTAADAEIAVTDALGRGLTAEEFGLIAAYY